MVRFILRSLVGLALGLTAAGLLAPHSAQAGDGAGLAGCILINGGYLLWRYVKGVLQGIAEHYDTKGSA